jgi:hypothetical protein
MHLWRILIPYSIFLIAIGWYLATFAPPETVMLRREVSVADVIGFAIGGSAILGLLINASQVRRSVLQETQQTSSLKAQLLLRIRDMLFEDSEERKFVYELDYQQFKFDAHNFPGSDEERHVDSLLYKLVHIGYLLRVGLLKKEDLTPVRSIVGCIMHNAGVGSYLAWLKETQYAEHTSFQDAVFLTETLFGRSHPNWRFLERYLAVPATTVTGD